MFVKETKKVFTLLEQIPQAEEKDVTYTTKCIAIVQHHFE